MVSKYVLAFSSVTYDRTYLWLLITTRKGECEGKEAYN